MHSGSESTLIADAGPLIGLARIGALWLVDRVVDHLLVPSAVVEECCGELSRPGAERIRVALGNYRWKVIEAEEGAAVAAPPSLGAGEWAVIRIAQARGLPVLLDDHQARRTARRLGIRMIGTGTLLLIAKKKGAISEIAPFLDQLREASYRMSECLVRELLRRADEP